MLVFLGFANPAHVNADDDNVLALLTKLDSPHSTGMFHLYIIGTFFIPVSLILFRVPLQIKSCSFFISQEAPASMRF